ncbi:MAG: hypothetical protein JXR94_00235 [Candidatus Hydrogenedentes bacterium]|nr:hypothetical protein [Candidatus Hydrogenedentota bacterium]
MLLALVAAAVAVSGLAYAQDEPDPKASDPNMAEVKISLPDASFSGTPLDYWSEHLDLSIKPRGPFYAPKGTTLLSLNKPVACSDKSVPAEKLKMVTDGDKKFDEASVLVLKPGVQYVQIDLGKPQKLFGIVIWHFHEYERVYFDVVVQVSNDPNFKEGVTTLLNNDYDNSAALGQGKDKEFIEKETGRLVDAKGTEARYVRLYSNGNTTDDMNTYVEVDVYGLAAE